MAQFGLNDIVTAGRVAWGIYQYGFSKARSAHVEYAAFGVDIREFAENLDRLQEAIQRATDARKLVPSFSRPQEDLSSLNTVLGNFGATLEDCKKIMNDKAKFKRDNSGFVHNIQWNFMLADQVKSLRERIAFHSVKLLTIMKPLEIKLYSDIWQAIWSLRNDMADMREDILDRFDRLEGILVKDVGTATMEASRPIQEELPLVPTYLVDRFQETVSAKFRSPSFPLHEGVDALAFHFGKSTVKFQPDSQLSVTPEPLQFLNLMKSVWILSQLKGNPRFSISTEVDALWKMYLKELELKMIKETKRFGSRPGMLQRPSEQDILLLPNASFAIFIVPGSSAIKSSLLEPRGLEEKIFQVSLRSPSDSRKQEVTVYRVNESRLRIITVTTSTIQGDREIEAPEVDLERVHLSPLYALPEAHHDGLSLSWKANVSDLARNAVSFNTLEDLRKFQQAITNFQVLHDRSGLKTVSCKKSGLFSGARTLATRGRIQIWNYKPIQVDVSESGSPRTSTTRTSGSRGREFVATLNPSSKMTSAGAGSLIESARPPLLVLLTENRVDGDDVLGFITVSLDSHTKIEPESCKCKKASANCTRAVIERKGGLVVKYYSSKGPRDQWNLAALRSPSHSDASTNVESLRGLGFLSLDFVDVQRRIEFTERFDDVMLLFRLRCESANRDLKIIKRLDVAD